ncbi:MAG: hypothetical protein HOG68_03545 [Candidatus Marinimicrobia bacterium]|jgi:hypothetical protein|nr:hypothetical protein [Candidatus Neomarinimicrobiota bacterium]MBT4991406.1 hypothetical protein [Candidatus Neomarinimicrobiota bacterium]MBT6000086.1 hypothetical protein [Candidatus Neomarinimicrobiota bacterium]MBT6738146.1 hypothetical protein [Candidatus Neomarinimicrobiota bacterium]
MNGILNFISRIGQLDRRWIFLIIALVVLIPLFFPLGLPIRATESTRLVWETVENLEPESKVLLSLEYGPSTKPELHPMVFALVRHLLKNDHKIYMTCLWPDGQFMAEDLIEKVIELEFPDKSYGEDYVLLGFRPGGEAVIKGIVSNIRKLYTVDARNLSVDEIPMMEAVNQFKDFDFLFSASAGFPGTVEWVQYASDPTGVPMSTGTTSIQVNEVMPYVQGGQVKGILAGMPGAAEYEALIGVPGIGTSGMDAQSIAHVVIVLFIIFGNVAYFVERKKAKKY